MNIRNILIFFVLIITMLFLVYVRVAPNGSEVIEDKKIVHAVKDTLDDHLVVSQNKM